MQNTARHTTHTRVCLDDRDSVDCVVTDTFNRTGWHGSAAGWGHQGIDSRLCQAQALLVPNRKRIEPTEFEPNSSGLVVHTLEPLLPQRVVMLYDWEGNRRSGIALAMRPHTNSKSISGRYAPSFAFLLLEL